MHGCQAGTERLILPAGRTKRVLLVLLVTGCQTLCCFRALDRVTRYFVAKPRPCRPGCRATVWQRFKAREGVEPEPGAVGAVGGGHYPQQHNADGCQQGRVE
jgi:hypothetical protein